MMNSNQFHKQVEQEIHELSEIKKKLQNQLADVPEGTLHVHKFEGGKYFQYYVYLDGQERYLSTRDYKTMQALAQKTYNEKVLAIIESRLRSARRLLKAYKQNIKDVYLMMPDARKKLITPIISTDEEFIRQWYERHPGMANPYPKNSGLYTERGEEVRSKSEKILADLFSKHGIPYVYEPQMVLKGGKTIYPDFLLLNVNQRITYIYEHFGMMDNPEYAKNAIEKVNLYLENGYLYGKTLLYSMETSMIPINIRNIEKELCEFLN